MISLLGEFRERFLVREDSLVLREESEDRFQVRGCTIVPPDSTIGIQAAGWCD